MTALAESKVKDSQEWAKTIENVKKGVCYIVFRHSDQIDGFPAISDSGTGFYVDAEHGYVLTNRHIAGPGPFAGYVVFNSYMEFDAEVVYTDPNHDFAILKLDTGNPHADELVELSLVPEEARIGVELRLLGNDAGNKFSIGRAQISRLDSNAPDCGEGLLFFNTNYISAMFSARGGSSGSPAVNIEGHVVGLYSAFILDHNIGLLLPVDLPLRALNLLRQGHPIRRGTLQTKWSLLPLNECERYQLLTRWSNRIRDHDRFNAIRADVVLPKGPGDGKIEIGDILLEVNGGLMTDLISLEVHMDENIGNVVNLRLWRGNEDVLATCQIGDLHAIVPQHFISRDNATFHDLSIQHAIREMVPVSGVYVTATSHCSAFINGTIIESINDEPVPDMERLCQVLSEYDGGGPIKTCHRNLFDPDVPQVNASYLSPILSVMERGMRREHPGGKWVPSNNTPRSSKPQHLAQARVVQSTTEIKRLPANEGSIIDDTLNSLVFFDCYAVGRVEPTKCGFKPWRGWGVIIDQKKGLVVAVRGSITRLCRVVLCLGERIRVAARITFLHEAQDLMLLEYDTSNVHGVCDELRAIQFSDETLHQDKQVYHVPFHDYLRIGIRTTIEYLCDVATDLGSPGAFVPMSCEQISLQSAQARENPYGLLLDMKGALLGLQTMSKTLVSVDSIQLIVSYWKRGKLDSIRYQDFDTDFVTITDAVMQGLSMDWVSKAKVHSSKRQVIRVKCVPSHCVGSNGKVEEHPLQPDDIILTLNEKHVFQSSDWPYVYEEGTISLHILRQAEEIDVVVPTRAAKDLQVSECIDICGMTAHRPNLSLMMKQHPCSSEVYLAWRKPGSPAEMYRLPTGEFLTAINGTRVVSWRDFVNLWTTIPNNQYFTIRTELNKRPSFTTIKKSTERFPTYIIAENPDSRDFDNPWTITMLPETGDTSATTT